MTPYATKPDPRSQTTRLWFKPPDADFCAEYYLYGGICWPKTVTDTGTPSVRGHVVLLGMNTRTRHHYLFAETAFVSIDHIFKGNTFLHRGVAQWFLDTQKTWGPLVSYWWGDQAEHVFIRNYRQLGESQLASQSVGLQFGHALFQAEIDPMQALYERIQRGVIHAPRDSQAYKEAKEYKAKIGEDPAPALHALLCAVAGDEQYPWRDRDRAAAAEEMLVYLK